MRGSLYLFKNTLLCVLAAMIFNNAEISAEPVLQTDMLLIKFIDGTIIYKNITDGDIMLTGIESLDSLSIRYEVSYYKKLAKDYPVSSSSAMYYRVTFHAFKAALSRERFATSCFKRRFSSSSALSRLASFTDIP